MATPLRIQAVLYNMSAPGGPFYAPREVRSAAYHTLKILYPVRIKFAVIFAHQFVGNAERQALPQHCLCVLPYAAPVLRTAVGATSPCCTVLGVLRVLGILARAVAAKGSRCVIILCQTNN